MAHINLLDAKLLAALGGERKESARERQAEMDKKTEARRLKFLVSHIRRLRERFNVGGEEPSFKR